MACYLPGIPNKSFTNNMFCNLLKFNPKFKIVKTDSDIVRIPIRGNLNYPHNTNTTSNDIQEEIYYLDQIFKFQISIPIDKDLNNFYTDVSQYIVDKFNVLYGGRDIYIKEFSIYPDDLGEIYNIGFRFTVPKLTRSQKIERLLSNDSK